MDRREFLKRSLLAAGGMAVGSLLPGSAHAQGASRVAICRKADLAEADDQTANAWLRTMTFTAIADALGATSIQAAMQRLFKSDDVVGIKLSALAPQFAPTPAVVYALVEALGYAGVKPEQVIIFDKEDRDLTAAGWTCTATGTGPRVYGTVGETKGPGYETRFTEFNKTSYCLSKILTREITALINVPILKQHSFAGMSGALKNHFGCIHNPEDFHYIDGCNPAVADVNLAPAIRNKQRLCVMDAFCVQYEGGPAYNASFVDFYGGILAATDPVAMDAEALLILDAFRAQHDLKPLKDTPRPCKHIATAASYGLGCDDVSRIQVVARNL